MAVDKSTGLTVIRGGKNRYKQVRPDFLTLRGAGGQLDPRFQASLGESLSALKGKGLTQGDTEAASLARQQQEVMRQADVDRLREMQATGVAQGMRNLGMRGGVSTGSRERLMRDATKAGLRGFQGIGRENRLANLQISAQDEAMKNQLLGQTGLAEQTIQESNIGRLAEDIARQNQAKQMMYAEDMAAYGAQQTARAQRRAGSGGGGGLLGGGGVLGTGIGGGFAADTYVAMADGTKRAIKNISLFDELKDGGRVTGTMQFLAPEIYDYKGVKVTGRHAVKEDGKWIRVQDSEHAQKIKDAQVVYNLNCTGHIILVNDLIFADFDETDHGSTISDTDSLEVLNGKILS